MNEPIDWLRPVIFLAALLFLGALVVRTMTESAHQRQRLERWLQEVSGRTELMDTNHCPRLRRMPQAKDCEMEEHLSE